jgi:phage FluMu gp28-like protein
MTAALALAPQQPAHGDQTVALLRQAMPPLYFQAAEAWFSTFYPFQLDWLLDWRRFAILDKCRQIGGSHSFAAWGVLHGLLGEGCAFVSKKEENAIEILGLARKHADVLADLGCDWARVVSPPNKLEFTMASGARIASDTSTGAARGRSCNVVLDEFAYHEHPDDVWDAALAATTHGYACRVLSTPNGVGNLFHATFTETAKDDRQKCRPNDWLAYLTTIHDAIAQGMRIDLDAAWAMAHNDPRLFDQLFCGVFLDGAYQYLPDALLTAATKDGPCTPYGQTFAGLDIGENRDRTTLVVIRGANGVFETVHSESHARTDDVLIDKLINDAIAVHKAWRVAVDGTGLGTFPAQAAQRKHGLKLDIVKFTGPSKEALATGLYQALVSEALILRRECAGSDEMRKALASIKRIVTAAGNVRYDAARTKDGHADQAWALALAVGASATGQVVGAYAALRGLVKREARAV